MIEPYIEIKKLLSDLTGKKNIIIIGSGRGPLNRILDSSIFNEKKRLSTNLALPLFFKEHNIKVESFKKIKNNPLIMTLPIFQLNTVMPEIEEFKFQKNSFLFLPTPLSMMDFFLYKNCKTISEFFKKSNKYFSAYIFSFPFCDRKFGGFIALDDDELYEELEKIYPLGGDFPEFGLSIDDVSRELLKVWNEENLKYLIDKFEKQKNYQKKSDSEIMVSKFSLLIDAKFIKNFIDNRETFHNFVNSMKFPWVYLTEDYRKSSYGGIEIDLRSSEELRGNLVNISSNITEKENFIPENVEEWI